MDDHTLASLKHVTLRIRDQLLLPNTNWQIEKGQHWAILGPNGAGKSTLVRALTGDVAVVRGRISVLNQFERRHTGYVSFEQHQQLIAHEDNRDESLYFSGKIDHGTTAYDMLIDGDSESDARIAEIDRVANKLKIGSLLEKRLRVLSTGEMRKVQIARALINSPKILILDEATSSVDPYTETLIQDALNKAREGRTTIIIAHRLSTIKNANLIIVLDAEKKGIIEKGKHESLLALNGKYKRLLEMQHRDIEEES